MGKKPTFFTKRGEKKVKIQLSDWDEAIEITVSAPTNREHDTAMEQHTEYSSDGLIVTHSAALIEDRLINHIVDLPFEIPKDESMKSFTTWKDAAEAERRLAVNLMESRLRDAVNNAIVGEEELSEEESGNSE